jgi:hypothetical protein
MISLSLKEIECRNLICRPEESRKSLVEIGATPFPY